MWKYHNQIIYIYIYFFGTNLKLTKTLFEFVNQPLNEPTLFDVIFLLVKSMLIVINLNMIWWYYSWVFFPFCPCTVTMGCNTICRSNSSFNTYAFLLGLFFTFASQYVHILYNEDQPVKPAIRTYSSNHNKSKNWRWKLLIFRWYKFAVFGQPKKAYIFWFYFGRHFMLQLSVLLISKSNAFSTKIKQPLIQLVQKRQIWIN